MQRQNIFIGVDGGATKSKVIIEDNNGNVLGQSRGGPVALRLGVENSWHEVMGSISMALREAGLSLDDQRYRFCVGMGLSGCEMEDKYQEFIKAPHPFAELLLVSDSYAACLGAHDGKDGASIIIGTGTVGYQIYGDKTLQVAGWGFPHDDQASGAWIGLKTIEMTFKWLDGRLLETSPIFEIVWERFGKNLSDMVTWANTANSTRFAEITPLVLQQLKENDAVAVALIKRAARHVDEIFEALVRRTDSKYMLMQSAGFGTNRPDHFKDAVRRQRSNLQSVHNSSEEGGQQHSNLKGDWYNLPFTLFGGIAPFLEPWLCDALKARLVTRKHDATVGAILALKRKINN